MQGPIANDAHRHYGIRDYLALCLTRGQRYRVIRQFVDLDGDNHPVGEEWFFVSSGFVPYDDLWSLFVAFDDGQEWCIPLHAKKQTATVHNVEEFVKSVAGEIRDDLFATARCVECLAPLERSHPNHCLKCHRVWTTA
jgi:hypothetical protein